MARLVERTFDDYLISTDPVRLDVGVIHGFLRESYWAEGIPRDIVERAIRNSLCFGVYSRLSLQLLGKIGRNLGQMGELPEVIAQTLSQCAQLDDVVPELVLGHVSVHFIPARALGIGSVSENLSPTSVELA